MSQDRLRAGERNVPSNSSAARVSTVTPVRRVRSRSGAKSAEWTAGSCAPVVWAAPNQIIAEGTPAAWAEGGEVLRAHHRLRWHDIRFTETAAESGDQLVYQGRVIVERWRRL